MNCNSLTNQQSQKRYLYFHHASTWWQTWTRSDSFKQIQAIQMVIFKEGCLTQGHEELQSVCAGDKISVGISGKTHIHIFFLKFFLKNKNRSFWNWPDKFSSKPNIWLIASLRAICVCGEKGQKLWLWSPLPVLQNGRVGTHLIQVVDIVKSPSHYRAVQLFRWYNCVWCGTFVFPNDSSIVNMEQSKSPETSFPTTYRRIKEKICSVPIHQLSNSLFRVRNRNTDKYMPWNCMYLIHQH